MKKAAANDVTSAATWLNVAKSLSGLPCDSRPQGGPNREPNEVGRGWKRRNSRQSAVFGEAGNGTVAGISELVRVVGVEPTRISSQEPKSCASANSAIPANISVRAACRCFVVLNFHMARNQVGVLRLIRIHKSKASPLSPRK